MADGGQIFSQLYAMMTIDITSPDRTNRDGPG